MVSCWTTRCSTRLNSSDFEGHSIIFMLIKPVSGPLVPCGKGNYHQDRNAQSIHLFLLNKCSTITSGRVIILRPHVSHLHLRHKATSILQKEQLDDSRRKTQLLCHTQLCEWRRGSAADLTLCANGSKTGFQLHLACQLQLLMLLIEMRSGSRGSSAHSAHTPLPL